MNNVEEIKNMIGSTLGEKAKNTFDLLEEDFSYYVKSISMLDLKTPIEYVKIKFMDICKSIVYQSVITFLCEKYNNEINISNNEIYDKNMNILPEISEMKRKYYEIVYILLEKSIKDFKKGRNISKEIVQRVVSKSNTKPGKSKFIPLEKIEIEMYKIEKKLPNITEEEANELKKYYSIICEKNKGK